jgi:hypothetical protein
MDEGSEMSSRESLMEDGEESDGDGSEGSGGEKEAEKDIEFVPSPPDEGVYGMAVASVIVDSRRMSLRDMNGCRYLCRLSLVLLIVLFTVGLQMYITIMTKWIVTPNAVRDIRASYGDYEKHMYDGHTYLTAYNHHRGIEGFFNISRFETIGQDTQKELCAFPLSEPRFLFVILLLWTLTCFRYLRNTVAFTYRILVVKTVDSMATSKIVKTDASGRETVIGLTCFVKFFITFSIQLPCFVMNVLLLWIGSRWLVATLGFDELLLNAIALEFVLVLHELLYFAIVPYSMKQALGNVLIPHPARTQGPNWINMFGTYMLLILAIVWTACYIRYWQQVLPEYNWDISEACNVHELLLEADSVRNAAR